MNKRSHEAQDVRKSLLLLVVIANTVILEKSLTANQTIIWWFLISIPLLVFLFFRVRQHA